uniref:NAD(P)(+)--arginine ADP-ribosyltransferase n=1 Tax=Anolis carolinensis TaxID=28377 RepID=H9GTS1_ANOCA|nr:PREDICTED: erythroblast NAD(P)(+)--arginine ADP-ribosyltransferase [Anolis carolinensis]|eukprot:XP_008114723.1 PREDICTED: erythroblast NAD(P)(+)--arginine ADP-ribosyltransferase [Anolis carolinensis]
MERPSLIFILITFMVLSHVVTSFNKMSKKKARPELNMAHASLDDQYDGCMASMKRLLPSLFRSELNASTLYSEAWEKALFEWQENKTWLYPRKLEELSEVALYAYTLGYPPLYQEFNSATRTAAKGPEEYAAYPFKSLHFLLTWATRFLGKKFSCQRVYRGTGVNFSVGHYFRFGQFTSTSEDPEIAQFFQTVTYFKLVTCKGIGISEASYFQHEQEVLVPPYEMFKVTSVEKHPTNKTIMAVSVGTCSDHNCIFVGEDLKYTKRCQDHQVLYL